MMQHTLENRIPYPPFGYSHYYPTFPLPHPSQCLHQCSGTNDSPSPSPTFDSRSTSIATPPELPEGPSTSKPGQRPFKAISKGHLEFRNFLYNDKSFQEYRNRVLSNLSPKNELCVSMRRFPQKDTNKVDDPEYLAKRRKNNEAAKRSREMRKMKEDELAVRCAFLEQENMRLKVALTSLESEMRNLRSILMYHPVRSCE